MVFSVQYYSLLYYSVSICIEFIDFFLHLFFKNLSISIIRLLLSPQNFSIFHRRKEISLYSIPSLKFINFSFISSQNFHRYEFSCAIPSQNLLIFLLFSKFLDFLIFLYSSPLQNYSRRFSTFPIFHKFLSSYHLLKIYQFSKSILSLSLSLPSQKFLPPRGTKLVYKVVQRVPRNQRSTGARQNKRISVPPDSYTLANSPTTYNTGNYKGDRQNSLSQHSLPPLSHRFHPVTNSRLY